MKKSRWQEITELYNAALELPENERAVFLKTHAKDDIRREVQSLLANERDVNSLFEAAALGVVAEGEINESAFLAGRQLGNYKINARIGRGGMGEVYRAKDQNLGRDVAIKVLPEEFARDKDRIARFRREAKLLASLNHPNIAAIHGMEDSDGIHFLVLELVEGETLAERLKRGSIPVEESLNLALQITEALEAAHEKRVIHRDLKPANIKVTPGGKVKILDFGLAKALAEEQQESSSVAPTLSAAATQQGVILGTAAYMSPEQARGKAVDKRADIWAFGCVLYEMLAGRAAFSGEEVSDILAAVIRAEPDWRSLPQTLHWRPRELIERCLQKETKDRYHDISDVRLDIQKAIADPNGAFVQAAVTAAPEKRLHPRLEWIVALVILSAIISGVAVWKLKPPEPHKPLFIPFDLPEDQQIDANILQGHVLAASPDGHHFAYCTGKGLFLKSLNERDAKLIYGADEDSRSPFFSPDGQSIGYFSLSDKKLKRIDISEGTPITLCSAKVIFGVEWLPDHTIIFGNGTDGIYRVSDNGGKPKRILEGQVIFPQLLPDGKSILYTDLSSPPNRKIFAESLESKERKELLTADWARYLPSGYLVYWQASKNGIKAVPFDPGSLEFRGEEVTLDEYSIATVPAISDSGTMVYISGSVNQIKLNLLWADRNGIEQPLTVEPQNYMIRTISPDGSKVAVAIEGTDGNTDIHILDLANGSLSRLTRNSATDGCPIWTPDSKQIIFRSNRDGEGIYRMAADGKGGVEKIISVLGHTLYPASWADDGNILAVSATTSATGEDIGIVSMEGSPRYRPLLHERYDEKNPQISPNGRYMAYSSNESGQWEILVSPFPDVKQRQWTICKGCTGHMWSGNGSELFYRSGDAFIVVPVKTEPTFSPFKAVELFHGTYAPSWHASSDGKRFLLSKPLQPFDNSSAPDSPSKINIVRHWFEELKERVPVN